MQSVNVFDQPGATIGQSEVREEDSRKENQSFNELFDRAC